jgi:hypothetical protein
VAVPFWEGGSWRAHSRRLPDRAFGGYAYDVPAPGWFVRDAPAEDPVNRERRRAALELRLHTTPLGRMCRHPEIRQALAQDRLAAALEPVLQVPDLLAGEDRLEREWRLHRPAVAAQADAALATLERRCGGWPPEVRRWRRQLRCAAWRRLDAAATGREIFQPCPAYFGEPYVAGELAPGLSFKAGIVRRAEYWPTRESEARSRAWRADDALVAAVEARLFPLAPGAAWSDAALAAALEVWLGTADCRDFQSRSPLPLFPAATLVPEGRAPAGFRVRIRPETMRALGGSYLTLAAAGLSPWLAAPFHS